VHSAGDSAAFDQIHTCCSIKLSSALTKSSFTEQHKHPFVSSTHSFTLATSPASSCNIAFSIPFSEPTSLRITATRNPCFSVNIFCTSVLLPAPAVAQLVHASVGNDCVREFTQQATRYTIPQCPQNIQTCHLISLILRLRPTCIRCKRQIGSAGSTPKYPVISVTGT
jgi:hypothetical protein